MGAAAVHELIDELDYPMLIVTAAAGGQRAGCLVGFATQCSIDPPRMLVCVSKANHTYRVAVDADVLAVHFLRRDDGAILIVELDGPAVALPAQVARVR